VVVYACHPSYREGTKRRITVLAGLGKKCETLLEKLLKQKGLGMGSKWHSTHIASEAMSSNPSTFLSFFFLFFLFFFLFIHLITHSLNKFLISKYCPS
jgi:hypothetical protein